jgi:hypothetical protein
MNKRYHFLWTVTALAVILGLFALSGCSGSNTTGTSSTTSPGPGPGPGGAVVQSDSIISAEVKAVRSQSTGYPWEIDIVVKSSENVNDLPNPTSDKVGQTVTVKTDEDASSLKAGQMINARVKYVGDVPKPGVTLYIYSIEIMPAKN